jgi:hypothetical protein
MDPHATPGIPLAVREDQAGDLRLWWRPGRSLWPMGPMVQARFVFLLPGVDWLDSSQHGDVSHLDRIPTNASQVLELILLWPGRCEIPRPCSMLSVVRVLETNILLPRLNVPMLKKLVLLLGDYV